MKRHSFLALILCAGAIECGEICSCHLVTSPDMVKMACMV